MAKMKITLTLTNWILVTLRASTLAIIKLSTRIRRLDVISSTLTYVEDSATLNRRGKFLTSDWVSRQRVCQSRQILQQFRHNCQFLCKSSSLLCSELTKILTKLVIFYGREFQVAHSLEQNKHTAGSKLRVVDDINASVQQARGYYSEEKKQAQQNTSSAE